jgi:hypothetical protein
LEQSDAFSEFLSRNDLSSLFEEEEPAEPALSEDEIAKVTQYLENPTSNGYWRLSGRWLTDGKFSQFISDAIANTYFQNATKSSKSLQLERARLQREFANVARISLAFRPLG